MEELLFELIRRFGQAWVTAKLQQLMGGDEGARPQSENRIRVDLANAVADEDFELLDRDNEVYAWDEPGALEGFPPPKRRKARR